MILLSFTVRNHRSIRDEITVDLTRPTLRTLRAPGDDWQASTFPVAGVFGPNASGKSAVLEALIYAVSAIRYSATTWQASKSMQRAPFLLDGRARTTSSMYELDFVHEGRRHLYGFEVDHDGIKGEWLRDVPRSRWRTLLDRDRDANVMAFGQGLRGRIDVTGRELVLSRALLLHGSPLHSVARDLASRFDFVLVKDSHREARLKEIADSLSEGTITFADLEALLQVADIGVANVSIEERDIPERVRSAILRFERDLQDEGINAGDAERAEGPGDAGPGGLDDDERARVVRSLLFTHRGAAEERPAFSIQDESDGTIAWLATAVPALEVLREGGVLVVDEIDASLHPHLLEVLLGAFADPSINTRQAQLIFTSHESYVLSPLSGVRLEPEQVWLTDKSYGGVTGLTCLAEFPKHPEANVAKRYLSGRYGGTPRLSPSVFAALVGSGER